MTALNKLCELLNASGEVDYLQPLGDRLVIATLYDGTRLIVTAEAIV
jgi:hypothetical protein